MKPLMKTLVLFLSLQAADFLTTLLVFHRGGREMNPLVTSIFPWLGPVGGVAAVKFLLMASACVLYYYRDRLRKRFDLLRVLRRASIAYCAVVCWNAAMLAV
jgi:hypothetical protein